MKRLFTLTLLLCGSMLAFAQQGTISGKVSDEDGEVLIGASILVQGSSAGATTDLNGNYELMVDPGSYTVRVSYVGPASRRSIAGPYRPLGTRVICPCLPRRECRVRNGAGKAVRAAGIARGHSSC